MTEQRIALRQAIDTAVRERVAAENAKLGCCAGCGMPWSDFTPGCASCWNRHRNYRAGRTRSPFPPDPVFDLHIRMLIRDNGSEYRSRNGRQFGSGNLPRRRGPIAA